MRPPASETELVRAAQSGDRAAFDELAQRYRPRLAALVRDRLGPQLRQRLEVDDVLQETFFRAFSSFSRYRETGEDSLFHWLAGVALNVIREEQKRVSRMPPAAGSLAEVTTRDPSGFTSLRREERLARLERALAQLPLDYRRVIRLTRIDKLPPDEVARRMNRSRQAVRSLLMRALRALKDTFGDTESLHLPERPLGDENESDGERR